MATKSIANISEYQKQLLESAPEEPAPLYKYRDGLMKAAKNPRAWAAIFPKVQKFPLTYVGMLKNLPLETQVLLQTGAPRSGKTLNVLYGLAVSWWDKLEYGGGDLKLKEIYKRSAKQFIRGIEKTPLLIYDEAEQDIDMRVYNSFLFRAFQIMLDSQAFLYRWIAVIHPAPKFSPEVFRHFTYAQVAEKYGKRPGYITAYRIKYNYKAWIANKRPLYVMKIDEYLTPIPPKPILEDFWKIEPEAKREIRKWIYEELDRREEEKNRRYSSASDDLLSLAEVLDL